MDRTWFRYALALGVTLGLLAPAWVVGVGFTPGAEGTSSLPGLTPPGRPAPHGAPETLSFTYQGRLDYNGQPADGLYDFIVEAWTSKQLGTKVADCFDVHMAGGLVSYPVEDGLFTFHLVCAPVENRQTFTGQNLRLQVSVRPAGGGAYTILPRQPIAGTPYAFSLYPGALISGTVYTPGGEGGALGVVNPAGAGIFGESGGTLSQSGDAAYLVSRNFRGLYAVSEAGYFDAYFAGVAGIYSAGGYWSLRADRLVAINGGAEALRPGDVVAMAGVLELPGGSPVLAVRPADAANGSAVVGVVAQAVAVEQLQSGRVESLDVQPVAGDVPPGGYLAIVTGGLAVGVRVESPAGGLKIGDWLTVSAVPGVTAKAGLQGEGGGALLGRVAGPVDAETGTVPVFVILH